MVVLARGAHSIITEGKIHSGWRDGAVASRTWCSYRGLRFNLQNQMVATNPCNSSSRWWIPFLHHFVMPCSFLWSCFLCYFISMVWVFCVHVCLCTIHAHPQRPDCEILTPDITFQPLKMKQTLANIGLSQCCLTFKSWQLLRSYPEGEQDRWALPSWQFLHIGGHIESPRVQLCTPAVFSIKLSHILVVANITCIYLIFIERSGILSGTLCWLYNWHLFVLAGLYQTTW